MYIFFIRFICTVAVNKKFAFRIRSAIVLRRAIHRFFLFFIVCDLCVLPVTSTIVECSDCHWAPPIILPRNCE